MFNLFLADFYKLIKSTIFKSLFLFMTGCAIAMTTLAYLITQGKVSASANGIEFLFSDINAISILGSVMAGIIICGDFDNKSIHSAVTAGFRRGNILLSKAILFCLSIGLLLLPYAIVVVVARINNVNFRIDAITAGYLHLITVDTVFSASEIGKLILALLLLMIVYVSQISICIPLSFALKKPVFVIAIYYAISILSGQLASLKGTSSLFDRIFSSTPFGSNYLFITWNSEALKFFQTFFVSILFFGIMLIISYCIFRKTEIK